MPPAAKGPGPAPQAGGPHTPAPQQSSVNARQYACRCLACNTDTGDHRKGLTMQDGKLRCVPVILNNIVRILWGQVMPCLR